MGAFVVNYLKVPYLVVRMKRKPQKILADNGTQFKITFENGCKDMDIEVEHTLPYYPQCKGKGERVIRTFNEEFLRIRSVFDDSQTLMPEFQAWYNDSRYHMGISDYPNQL